MNIAIKLENSEYCDGCPCLNEDNEFGIKCNLKFWDNELFGRDNNLPVATTDGRILRPQKCINENGE